MLKRLLLLSALLLPAAQLVAAGKYWIYFRDKGDESRLLRAVPGAVESAARSIGLSQRALERRLRVLPSAEAVTDEDLPVYPPYLSRLASAGVHVENVSRWFNAATAYLDSEGVRRVGALPFVSRVEPVRVFRSTPLPPKPMVSAPLLRSPTADLLDYGPSYAQIAFEKINRVHDLRITGRGVLIGMIDDGFRWRVHEATRVINVLKEYDFVQHDTITANQPNGNPPDDPAEDAHGTLTLSVIGGYKPGQLIGPAYQAQFMLAKTEIVQSETNIEEDNWVAAIEWDEANGVDVVSSSLGYNIFDDGQHSYTPQDMNGRTATTSKAALLAARRGVVVCVAAGNEAATSWHIITSPGDADSIITVGAVNPDGSYAWFSGVGPTSDGRTKPDVVGQGVDDYCAMTTPTGYYYEQGTSLSTPLVAGCAALILSVHPGLTPIEVRDALRNTASNAGAPNNSIGWGAVDVEKAILYNGMVMSTDPEIVVNSDSTISVGVYVVSPNRVNASAVQLHYSIDGGATYATTPMTISRYSNAATQSGEYVAALPRMTSGVHVRFYASAADSAAILRTAPPTAPREFFETQYGDTTASPGSLPATYVLYQNYPNPFNTSTLIRYFLPAAGQTSLTIYDLLGRKVRTLVDGVQDAGMKSVTFDGSSIASGVYFCRLRSEGFAAVTKLVLVK